MTSKVKYGWICADFDDERLECPFDSIEAAEAAAKSTIEEEAPDRDWEPGSRTLDVEVCEVRVLDPFNAAHIIESLIDRLADDGWDDPEAALGLDTDVARELFAADLGEAWGRHLHRENHQFPWEQATRGVTRPIVVTIRDES